MSKIFKPTYTEKQLLEGIRSRDGDVTAFLSREYMPSIRLLIYRLGGSTEDAKDMFQDAVFHLIRMSDDPTFELTSSIKTLLYSICRNRWMYKSRMNHRMVPFNPSKHDGVE
ncbi:MAG: sigma factor, partial [Bacteroidota bacterium]